MAHIWKRFLSWLRSYFFGRPKKSRRRPRTFKPRLEVLPDRTMIGADVSLGGIVAAAAGGGAGLLLAPALVSMMQPGQPASEPVQAATLDYGQADSGPIAPGQVAERGWQPNEIVMGVWPQSEANSNSEPASSAPSEAQLPAEQPPADDPLAENPMQDQCRR